MNHTFGRPRLSSSRNSSSVGLAGGKTFRGREEHLAPSLRIGYHQIVFDPKREPKRDTVNQRDHDEKFYYTSVTYLDRLSS